jgi:hypothetical protein
VKSRTVCSAGRGAGRRFARGASGGRVRNARRREYKQPHRFSRRRNGVTPMRFCRVLGVFLVTYDVPHELPRTERVSTNALARRKAIPFSFTRWNDSEDLNAHAESKYRQRNPATFKLSSRLCPATRRKIHRIPLGKCGCDPWVGIGATQTKDGEKQKSGMFSTASRSRWLYPLTNRGMLFRRVPSLVPSLKLAKLFLLKHVPTIPTVPGRVLY